MAELSASPSSATPRSRVVRSLARAAQRPCARPGCPAPARATLTFVYATRKAVLERLSEDADPQAYDLCAPHAARTEAPRGWGYVDARPDEDRAASEPSAPPRDLGSDATVAVLAAALRAVPDQPAPPADDAAAESAAAAAPPAATPSEPAEPEDAGPAPHAGPAPAAGSAPAAAPAPAGRPTPLPTPRRVPAAGNRGPTGPATDW